MNLPLVSIRQCLVAMTWASMITLVQGCALAPGTSARVPTGAVVTRIDGVTTTHPFATAPWPLALLDYQPQPYRIGTGDRIRVIAWDHPEFSTVNGGTQVPGIALVVHDDGYIRPPFIGSVPARGRTVDDLRVKLAKAYVPFFPGETLEVVIDDARSKPVTVRGAFRKTDPIRIGDEPLVLSRVLGIASIDESVADVTHLRLSRDGETFDLDLTAGDAFAERLFLKPGDDIHLPLREDRQVYVSGEVLRPSALPIGSSLSLAAALARAGGINPDTARASDIYVVRASHGQGQLPLVYQLDADSLDGLAHAERFPLHPGDNVVVGAAAVTRWGRFFRHLVPIGNVARNAGGVGTN